MRAIRIFGWGVAGLILLGVGAEIWARLNIDRSTTARTLVWLGADTGDWQRFPSRAIHAGPSPVALPTPEQQVDSVEAYTVDGQPLARFLEAQHSTAFLVASGETLVYERYFNGSSREAIRTSFSVAKSFASTLVGIAAAEGLLSLDDPVTRYIPELLDRDPRFSAITIRNLITMSSGLRYVERHLPWSDDAITYYAPDLRAAALNASIVEPPGTRFLYNNYNPLLIGMVLERATGMPVARYLEQRLWQPMGAEADASWSLDSLASGFEKMESGVNARAVDYLRLGLVFSHQGRIAGRQVVPADWVAEATRVDTSGDPAPQYQYFWWTFPEFEGFAAIGNFGQFIYVDPVADVTIVRMGDSYGDIDYHQWLVLMADIARQVGAAGDRSG